MPEDKKDNRKPEVIFEEIKSGFIELCHILDSKVERGLDITSEISKLQQWHSFMFLHCMYPEYNKLPDFNDMFKEISVKLEFAESSEFKIHKEEYAKICGLINKKVIDKEKLTLEFNQLKLFYAYLRDVPHSRANTWFGSFLEEVRRKIEEINRCIEQTKKYLEKKRDLAVTSRPVIYNAETRNEFSADLVNHKCYLDDYNEALYSSIMALLVSYSKNDGRLGKEDD